MSVRHPGRDPNAHLYNQLKRDVLERVPHIETVEYIPNDIEAKQLKAVSDPTRLKPVSGPESRTLVVSWYRQDPDGWFRVNYSDPNTGFHAGWHQDEDHPDLGRTHFQYATPETTDRWDISFDHETPSLILWEIIDHLLGTVIPTYY